MKKLYQFESDFGRAGTLSGIFVATEEEVQSLIGEEAYFGEVLGKGSNVSKEIEPQDITELTDDQRFIEKAIEYQLVPNGYNPLDYI